MRSVFAFVLFVLLMPVSFAPASATPSTTMDFASADSVLRWINGYRKKPALASVPIALRTLSALGAFKK